VLANCQDGTGDNDPLLPCNTGPILLGAGIGAIIAVIVDASVLGYDEKREQPAAALAFAPVIAVTRHAARFGLTGRF
jgi:hypothetical protein